MSGGINFGNVSGKGDVNIDTGDKAGGDMTKGELKAAVEQPVPRSSLDDLDVVQRLTQIETLLEMRQEEISLPNRLKSDLKNHIIETQRVTDDINTRFVTFQGETNASVSVAKWAFGITIPILVAIVIGYFEFRIGNMATNAAAIEEIKKELKK